MDEVSVHGGVETHHDGFGRHFLQVKYTCKHLGGPKHRFTVSGDYRGAQFSWFLEATVNGDSTRNAILATLAQCRSVLDQRVREFVLEQQ